jgi:hypothetical protein
MQDDEVRIEPRDGGTGCEVLRLSPENHDPGIADRGRSGSSGVP